MICALMLFIFCTFVKSSLLLQSLSTNIRLTDVNKYLFMKNVISWIEDRNVPETDSCFIINFGYNGFLPLPQAC